MWKSAFLGLVMAMTAYVAPSIAQTYAFNTPNPNVKIEITELKVTEDGMLTFRGTLVNKSGNSTSVYDMSGNHIPTGLTVQDTANRMKYLVVKDASGRCLCSDTGSIENGATVALWAKFGAPPAGTQKMDVYLGNLEPVLGVPVTR